MPPRICLSSLFFINTSCACVYSGRLRWYNLSVISLCTVDLLTPNFAAVCRTVAPVSTRYCASWMARSSGCPFTEFPPDIALCSMSMRQTAKKDVIFSEKISRCSFCCFSIWCKSTQFSERNLRAFALCYNLSIRTAQRSLPWQNAGGDLFCAGRI